MKIHFFTILFAVFFSPEVFGFSQSANLDFSAVRPNFAERDSIELWHIETHDGNDYIGSIVRQDAQVVVLKTEKLGEISIRKADIKSMEPIQNQQIVKGDYWFENPHSTRYFFAPNGYGLRAGEGYYQNTWVLFNQASYGFTDNFSIGVGTIPVFLFGARVFPLWITPKVSIPLKQDKLNLGVGMFYATAIAEDAGSGFGIAYGNLTIGSRDKNATFGLGYGIAEGGWANSPTLSFSAMHRMSKRHYFITENYLLPFDGYATVVLGAGGRWTGKRIAIDYALFRPFNEDLFFEEFFLIPWLGINVPFGKKITRAKR